MYIQSSTTFLILLFNGEIPKQDISIFFQIFINSFLKTETKVIINIYTLYFLVEKTNGYLAAVCKIASYRCKKNRIAAWLQFSNFLFRWEKRMTVWVQL